MFFNHIERILCPIVLYILQASMKLHICVLTALASLSVGVPVEDTLEALARRTYFYVGGVFFKIRWRPLAEIKSRTL